MLQVDELLEHPGPFVSVYLPIESAVEDSVDRMSARWGNARRDLEAQGADSTVLDLVEGTVLDLTGADAKGLAIIADRHGSMVTQLSDEAPPSDILRCSPIPSVVKLLRWSEAEVPHLLVVTDREGADIWVRNARGEQPDEPRREVDGDTANIHRAHPGGWSQRRFQQRSENTWDRNAEGVAEEIHRLAERVGARLIVASGDVRALGFLRQHLPSRSLEKLHVVEAGGRSDVDAAERVAHEADHLVSDLIARGEVAALERFAVARGHGLAVEGAADTLEALSEGRVDVLLVHDDDDDGRMAWAAPGGIPAAMTQAALEDLGLEAVAGRLADVAVKAALAEGAQVQIVPAHGPNTPAEHLGGVLRG